MHPEVIQVDCEWCFQWDEARRKEVECPKCKNSRKVPDPCGILCNLCGESTRPLGTWGAQSAHGLEDLEVIGGYFSTHLFDLRSYKFSLCEKCLRKIFNQCKIPPHVQEVGLPPFSSNAGHIYDEEVAYSADKESYDYRMWCDEGGHHQAYVNRKCNLVKKCPNTAAYTIFISDEFTEDCACEEHKDNRKNCVNCRLVQFIPNVLKPFL